mmetsp:Transcript_26341/g.87292  ORF Transcript_26341/g.87292 Transcript_26341/m.87292 type:complete len:441 (+) Transcript_26341:90-1412(+)
MRLDVLKVAITAGAVFASASASGPSATHTAFRPEASAHLQILLRGRGRSNAGATNTQAVVAQGQSVHRGVRDGAGGIEDGDDGDLGDEMLDRNNWLGQSQSLDFRPMDDLEPTAPMDGVNPPGIVSILSPEPLDAEHHNSMYVPPYRNPDAFPVVNGPECLCTKPPVLPPTDEQNEWAKEVAKQLGVRMSDLPKPMSDEGHIKCSCDENGAQFPHDWSKMEPITGTQNFKLFPADSTYPDGNYWSPAPKGGLVAPADVMSMENYPVQGPADRIQYLPAMAREDRVGLKFARYIDQVEKRSLDCDGDGISARCTTPCRPGDQVTAELGLRRFEASVLSTRINGMIIISFATPFAKGFLGTVPCPLRAACSAFRACLQPGRWCVQREGVYTRDHLGNLELALKCPGEAQICGSIEQVVSGKFLRKDGKLCRAARGSKKPLSL